MSKRQPAPVTSFLINTVAVAGVLLLLSCLGFLAPLDAAIAIAFGWIRHVSAVGPKVSFDRASIATFVCSSLAATLLLVRLTRGSDQVNPDATGTRDVEPDQPEGQEPPVLVARPRRLGLVVRALGLCLMLFVAGIAMVGVVHQSAWLATSPEPWISRWQAPYISQSRNNLKTLGVAVHDFHETEDHLPGGRAFSEQGEARHSWMTDLLPYLDEQARYRRVDFGMPWNDPTNRPAFRENIQVFAYPRQPPATHPKSVDGLGVATYAGNVQVLGPGRSLRLPDIKDGLSNTLLAGEVGSRFRAWADPGNVRDPALGVSRSPEGFGGPWENGTHFVFCDGSVKSLSHNIEPSLLRQLGTPAGNDEGVDALDRIQSLEPF